MNDGQQSTTDALEIIDSLFFKGDPEMERLREEAHLNLSVGFQINQLRKAQGLSQRKLAEMVGTSASTISRIESGEYGRQSLTTLKRIAWALKQRLVVRFEPLEAEDAAEGGGAGPKSTKTAAG